MDHQLRRIHRETARVLRERLAPAVSRVVGAALTRHIDRRRPTPANAAPAPGPTSPADHASAADPTGATPASSGSGDRPSGSPASGPTGIATPQASAGIPTPQTTADPRRPTRGLYLHRAFRLPLGRTLRYHVYARGIRWDRPVGVVVYLDGDYWVPAQSRVHQPTGATMLRLGAIASARNLVLIAVDTPDRRYSKEGFTWWVRARANGRVLRVAARLARRRLPVDPARTWVMGYSGGAEFLTFDLLAHRAPAWLRGGAIMVAGGGTRATPQPPPEAAAHLPLHWWIGQADGSPDSSGPLWSAQAAAAEGIRAYRRAGWRGIVRHELPEVKHTDYDLPGILRATLDDAGLRPRGTR
ncbi:hypothetical protein AB0O80_08565 [Rothia kristinae]|uniref:Esterase n=1 Tax=Rothia kristinae TaxID=37923 RepID=A0A199NTB3_9MICC|nr:hypothetical protein [Rothia kristinae]OAX51838.1 hypothetical protein AN277_0206565 [Rothia kristinae]